MSIAHVKIAIAEQVVLAATVVTVKIQKPPVTGGFYIIRHSVIRSMISLLLILLSVLLHMRSQLFARCLLLTESSWSSKNHLLLKQSGCPGIVFRIRLQQ
jgi:hypothetical protein